MVVLGPSSPPRWPPYRAPVRLEDFDYTLPPEAIAQRPVEPRDAARMLVHAVSGGSDAQHRTVRDLDEFLRDGDLLVVNDTRVRPARVLARRPSGGRVELLFLEALGDGVWRTLVRPGKKQRPGARLEVATGVGVELLERELAPDGTPAATWRVRWRSEADGDSEPVARDEALLEAHGEVPLPPYIQRAADAADRERYQTVYARESGSVAAPTAGLHLTPELLDRLAARGVERASVTLHVGLGTFAPVQEEDPRDHPMHAEVYHLPEATAEAVARTRARGGRVVCVGTTSARVLESCAVEGGLVEAGAGETRLFLHPGRGPRVLDGLLTNFHLPRTTLLMLVASFIGTETTLRLYSEALREGYRFFSYGDAMLLLRERAEP